MTTKAVRFKISLLKSGPKGVTPTPSFHRLLVQPLRIGTDTDLAHSQIVFRNFSTHLQTSVVLNGCFCPLLSNSFRIPQNRVRFVYVICPVHCGPTLNGTTARTSCVQGVSSQPGTHTRIQGLVPQPVEYHCQPWHRPAATPLRFQQGQTRGNRVVWTSLVCTWETITRFDRTSQWVTHV